MQLRRWIAAGKPVAKSDGNGLTFTLSASCTAAWILRYRLAGGRRRELTLGNYLDLSLAAARKAARAHRVAIDNGADPAAAKKTERTASAAAWTVNELVADFRVKRFAQDIEKPLAENTLLPRVGSRQRHEAEARLAGSAQGHVAGHHHGDRGRWPRLDNVEADPHHD
ncbi:DUF4102 domain-containing protein [Burkholderia sp. JP2-270]|uniref:DUF4102 domain-containing protein n=1 Tax=Burkholderia sp. JP2-270 TaxID=2217913 RepID=UPI001EF7B232|nr:DUF4102 domain-containing protein [Burkholderia sp. JP2-270]